MSSAISIWTPRYFYRGLVPLLLDTLFKLDRLAGLLNIRKDESIYRQVREAVGGIAPTGCFYDRHSARLLSPLTPAWETRAWGTDYPSDGAISHFSHAVADYTEFITLSSTRLYRYYASKMKTFSAPPFWFFHPPELLRGFISAENL